MPNDNDQPDATIIFPDRIVERNAGCWNCTHFTTGPSVEAVWEKHYEQRLLQIRRSGAYAREHVTAKPDAQYRVAQLTRQGVSKAVAVEMVISEAAAKDPRIEMLRKVTVDVRDQKLGICRIAANGADFVYRKYMCDSWSGAQGASMAIGTDAINPLPEELKEIVDAKAKDKR